MRSLMVRETTWWMPGRPFAVGGPSKNTNGLPSRVASMVCRNRPSAAQRASISRSSWSAVPSGQGRNAIVDGYSGLRVTCIAATAGSVACTEQGAADADHGGAFLDGGAEVVRHAHREFRQLVARRARRILQRTKLRERPPPLRLAGIQRCHGHEAADAERGKR